MKSVERYCPQTDTWTLVADLNECHCDAGVGVLNGVIYVVGGSNGHNNLNSVEAYNQSSNTWTLVSKMHKIRRYVGNLNCFMKNILFISLNLFIPI